VHRASGGDDLSRPVCRLLYRYVYGELEGGTHELLTTESDFALVTLYILSVWYGGR
jgi:hypothetical protein